MLGEGSVDLDGSILGLEVRTRTIVQLLAVNGCSMNKKNKR